MKLKMKRKMLIIALTTVAILLNAVLFTNIHIQGVEVNDDVNEATVEVSMLPVKEKVEIDEPQAKQLAEDVYDAVRVAEELDNIELTEDGEKETIEEYNDKDIEQLVEEKLRTNVSHLARAKTNRIVLYGESEKEKENQVNEDNVLLKTYDVIKAYPHKDFKSYMSWTALSPSSPQGKFSAKAEADPETAIMMYEDRYLVALGSAYADEVGQKIDIVMESGQVIPAVVGDFKADEHTDEYGSTQRWDGSVVEFVVSSNEAAAEVTKKTGSYNLIFPGLVKEFRK